MKEVYICTVLTKYLMEGFPTVPNKHQLFLLPTSVFPTTSLALGYWDLRDTSSLRVVGWIHITRSPLKHICFCCLLLWVCRREFRQSSAPPSSQESLLTCCPCLCHTGLHLSWVTDRGAGISTLLLAVCHSPSFCWQWWKSFSCWQKFSLPDTARCILLPHLPSKIYASKLHLTKVLAHAHGFTCFNGFSILISIQKMSVFSTDELQLPGRPGSDSLFNYFISWLKKTWDHPLGRRTSWRRNRGALSQAECILCYGLREPTHAVAHDTFKLGTAAELMTEFQLLLNVKEAVNASCAGLDSWLGHVA